MGIEKFEPKNTQIIDKIVIPKQISFHDEQQNTYLLMSNKIRTSIGIDHLAT
jgi:hypothetical protein